jgi:general secretion pathway protein H
LRDARTRAIEQRRVVVVRLDVGRRIVEPGDGARPLHLPGDVDLELHVGEAAAGRQGGGVVRFFPNGSSSGGRLELRRHGERFSIGINWFTGRIDAEASRS